MVQLGTAVTYYTTAALGNGVTRYYNVYTATDIGVTNELSTIGTGTESETTWDVPAAPTSLTATAGLGQITLDWIAPAEIGTELTLYKIYSGTSIGDITTLTGTVARGVLTYVHTPLGDGVTKYYEVSASNAVGEGSKTSEAHATTYNVPSVPTTLVATGGIRQMVLTWGVPADNGGTAITEYIVYVGTVIIGTTVAGTRTLTDTPLTNNQTKSYMVSAVNAVGEGSQTAASSGTTFNVPGAPTGLAIEPGDEQVWINSWVAPASNGGSAITDYYLYRGTVSGVLVKVHEMGGATILPYRDSSLVNGTTYYYKISAVSAVGEGAKSAEVYGLVTEAPVTLLNPYLFYEESLKAFVFDLTGGSSYTLPIATNFLVLAMIPSFTSATNITNAHYIVTDRTAKTVKVYDASGLSTLEFNLSVVVYCRDKLFQNDS
jgi:hypothetical protein